MFGINLLGHPYQSYHLYASRFFYKMYLFFSDFAAGACLTDQMSITTPGGIGSPIICGYNSGQHSKF